jgi:hypothetical protein
MAVAIQGELETDLNLVGVPDDANSLRCAGYPLRSPKLSSRPGWYRPQPRIGKALAERQDGQPAEAVAVAWSAQRRLHRTWTRLEARAKRRTIIAVAAAHELVGFCWAITQIE